MSRGWLLASLWFGCGFKPGGTAATTDDATVDSPPVIIDAAPDADVPFSPACLADLSFTKRTGTTHSYKQLAANLSFDNAFDACSNAGGAHLAQVEDLPENNYLHATFTTQNWWLGINDSVTEGTYHWSDRELGTFTHWAGPQEPSDGGNNHSDGRGEDFGIMQGDGFWNDVNGSETHNPVCECEPDFHAPVVPACRTAAGSKLGNGRKYFVLDAASWIDANTACTGMGGYLMVPSDADENFVIDDGGSLNANADVWIGLVQDPNNPAKWAWSNGSRYGYERWNNNTVPTPAATMCGKVSRNDNSNWESVDCTTLLRAVCECDPGVY